MPMDRFGEQVAGMTIRPGVAGVIPDAQDRTLERHPSGSAPAQPPLGESRGAKTVPA